MNNKHIDPEFDLERQLYPKPWELPDLWYNEQEKLVEKINAVTSSRQMFGWEDTVLRHFNIFYPRSEVSPHTLTAPLIELTARLYREPIVPEDCFRLFTALSKNLQKNGIRLYFTYPGYRGYDDGAANDIETLCYLTPVSRLLLVDEKIIWTEIKEIISRETEIPVEKLVIDTPDFPPSYGEQDRDHHFELSVIFRTFVDRALYSLLPDNPARATFWRNHFYVKKDIANKQLRALCNFCQRKEN